MSTMKRKRDRREARRVTNVVNVMRDREALLTRGKGGQLNWLIQEFMAAWKISRDDRSFDEFRRAHCEEVCGRRLSEATGADFELLMARAKLLQGKVGEALEWELKANPKEVERRRYLHTLLAFIGKKIVDKKLNELMSAGGHTMDELAALKLDPSPIAPTREQCLAYGDKLCQSAWCTSLERASREQMEYVYLRLKSPTRAPAEVEVYADEASRLLTPESEVSAAIERFASAKRNGAGVEAGNPF